MKSIALLAFGALILGAATPVFASGEVPLGLQAGVYVPTSSEIKDKFGDGLVSFGLGFSGIRISRDKALSPNVNVIFGDRNGSKFFVLPVTLGYEHHFGVSSERVQPYARVDAGVAYYDYAIDRTDGRYSNKTFGATGALEAGVIIDKKLQVSAAYRFFDKKDSFNFNGFQLNVTYQLLRF